MLTHTRTHLHLTLNWPRKVLSMCFLILVEFCRSRTKDGFHMGWLTVGKDQGRSHLTVANLLLY